MKLIVIFIVILILSSIIIGSTYRKTSTYAYFRRRYQPPKSVRTINYPKNDIKKSNYSEPFPNPKGFTPKGLAQHIRT